MNSEDPDLVWDLREHNAGRPEQYELFWEKCRKYLEESSQTAVDDRRQSTLMQMAWAMSAADLHKIVSEHLPADAKKPSVKWLLLQFVPKDPTCKRAFHYTGKLNVRFAAQSHLWRFSHVDHYAAALFKYFGRWPSPAGNTL